MADANDTPSTARDYRETVFLPETPFPMRGGLPQKEPAIIEQWGDLYSALRKQRQAEGAPLYVLHDGPPYANGDIHIGHALNKTLKDFVVRSRFLLRNDVDYVPGWDCHGLPIEWKIEEEYRKKGRRKDDVPTAEFRAECRAYAGHWIGEQMKGFQRLGVMADWENRYSTMDFKSEATIVAEFQKFVMSGQLYRGSKPVMWSPVERTALADAEVEYHDHVSPTVWVKFPLVSGGAAVVIWTTTPWTIPANRAVSYSPRIDYGVYEVTALEENLEFQPWAAPGDRLILADKLAEEVFKAAKVAAWTRVETANLDGVVLQHPLAKLDAGYGFPVPMLAGDHVTDDAGTGFVHTAPGHGADDYLIWLKSKQQLEAMGVDSAIPETVDPDGAYYPHVPLFAGLKVLETEGKKAGKFGPANGAVMEKLIEAGNLLARGRLEHSYPHSWRSKAPVIFRNTPQWFIRMDEPLENGETLRQRALKSIAATTFHPDSGRNRIGGMVETRPDWLISRQRAWGAPLAMFVDKETGEPLRDQAVNDRIVKLMHEEGADAWFNRPAADFLGNHDPAKYEKVEDILDVWFDSGSTHAFTLEGRDDSGWPADLYLEGSDQHRGWFQSSLLESCGTRGRAPYKTLVTHGFTLDENGQKMSKSLGNTVEPHVVIAESGAEILRLWTATVDYMEDQRIGKTILATVTDSYRKLRNTMRYLLGALDGFTDAERVAVADMPPLEQYILHRLWQLDAQVRTAYEGYRFNEVVRPLLDFCQSDLSVFFFDIRKDALYCDRPDSLTRRAYRTVLDAIFERLTIWLGPLMTFTMEEAWTTRFPDAGSNILRVFPETPSDWRNDAEFERWTAMESVVSAVTGALEIERREKRIGASLEAAPTVELPAALAKLFDGLSAAEIFRTSGATLTDAGELTVRPFQASGDKCDRCWRILPEVKADTRLCLRCEDAVEAWDKSRAA
ncbi:isoleucine--tRNA ligase [Brevundimonas sp. UBA2416]|uniref:isoleucine--tRNA ligase n=1 Tax=Brevundimonas sp. UBA2416 TaxID=1946124 RepID=UPI0025C481B7|nr:isoleucine--tRNA ligase [Brevundimonas sp. UBA2416]